MMEVRLESTNQARLYRQEHAIPELPSAETHTL